MEPGSSGNESTQISHSLKSRVFVHSKLIYELLNVKDLVAELLNTRFRFLTRKEITELYNTYGEQKRAGKLLLYLNNKKPPAIRRFIACILAETEHCGHKELSETIMNDLPEDEQQRIRKIVQKGTMHYRNEFVNMNISTAQYCSELGSLSSDLENESISSSDSSPEADNEESIETDSFTSKQGLIIKSHSIVQHVPPRPMPLITLKGHLKGRSFDKLDRKLWSYFSTGQYSDLNRLTIKLRSHVVPDYQIIGMWFDSLIYMHRDGNYDNCLMQLLFPALKLCEHEKTENSQILSGRVLQRIAQVFLVMGAKTEAQLHFRAAQEELQFVSKCYESVNMHCRRAKLLSATEPDKRNEIEDAYTQALAGFSDDDSFALASKPSLILSKAAFHLHISFGSKPKQDLLDSSHIQHHDIQKAKTTLKELPDEMLHLDMRKCEKNLLSAELLRLDGEEEPALESFKKVVEESKKCHLENLVAIAENRIYLINFELEKSDDVDKMLEDLP